jgi:hypothetical protein
MINLTLNVQDPHKKIKLGTVAKYINHTCDPHLNAATIRRVIDVEQLDVYLSTEYVKVLSNWFVDIATRWFTNISLYAM